MDMRHLRRLSAVTVSTVRKRFDIDEADINDPDDRK